MFGHAARYGFWWAVGKFSFVAAKMGAIIGGAIGSIVAASGAGAAVWYLYNNRVFY